MKRGRTTNAIGVFTTFYWGLLVLTALLLLPAQPLRCWGFWGHQRINRMAVFSLPEELLPLYKDQLEFITQHAVDPDKRRYSNPKEAPRHYIDLDHYGKAPYNNLPRSWKAAVAKYGEDSLNAYGIVPWQVTKVLYALTEAFRKKDKKAILHLSADLGHYVADAHVPLHTTENYNGQLTGQNGIHGFWESRIPESFGESYDYFTGTAVYLEKPLTKIWSIILESNAAKDSVLAFEAELNATFSPDQKYSFETRGSMSVKVYSAAYTKAYNEKLNGMVERRLRQSIIDVASFWYTAWVNAGQPDVRHLNESSNFQEEKTSAMDSIRLQRIKGHAE